MNGFEQRSEMKKAQIRKATLTLLSKAEPFTIKNIAEEAHVSQVSIYNYFGSKETLVLDVMRVQMEDTIKEYERLLNSETSFPDVIKKIMVGEQQMLHLFNGCLDQIGQNEDFMKMAEDFQHERLIPFFIELMETGKKLGYIQPNFEVMDLLFYFSMYKNEFARRTVHQDEAGISEEKLIQLFFYGLMGKPSV